MIPLLPALPFPPPFAPAPRGLPVGSVIAFAGQVAGVEGPITPAAGAGAAAVPVEQLGWMVCDGRLLQRAQFRELFAVLGYRYLTQADGPPGGSFRVPDLQGYFLRGVDPAQSVDKDPRVLPGGDPAEPGDVGSVQRCALQDHVHTYSPAMASPATSGGDSASVGTGTADTGNVVVQGGQPLVSQSETRPVNVSVYFLIKFTGDSIMRERA